MNYLPSVIPQVKHGNKLVIINCNYLFKSEFPVCFRLTPQQQTQLSQQLPSSGNSLQAGAHCTLGGTSPLAMPVFPLRSAHNSHTPHYSPYSPSRFHIDKRCQHRCSWKCLSIVLILLVVALTAMLAYFAGNKGHFNIYSTWGKYQSIRIYFKAFSIITKPVRISISSNMKADQWRSVNEFFSRELPVVSGNTNERSVKRLNYIPCACNTIVRHNDGLYKIINTPNPNSKRY